MEIAITLENGIAIAFADVGEIWQFFWQGKMAESSKELVCELDDAGLVS